VACCDAGHRAKRRRSVRSCPALAGHVGDEYPRPASSVGGAVGLLADGIPTQAINWHWIFSLTDGYHLAFLIAACLVAVAIVVAGTVLRSSD